ncbi:hypothetical protein JCGZ_22055 [Jatropha curcas]|uniref:Uncharacterized protein n=1 Tax=Jatropha curcas TaxID=180498 RepID=A0A067L847_JATCU|nr:hypothetical protein JCGZ_22055 [Jatropha curcas]
MDWGRRVYQLKIGQRFHDHREERRILSLGASPGASRPVAEPPPATLHGGPKFMPLLDLSGAYTTRLKNSPGTRIHAPFVHLVSLSVGIGLDSRSTAAFNGTSTIRATSSKLKEGKCFGGE